MPSPQPAPNTNVSIVAFAFHSRCLRTSASVMRVFASSDCSWAPAGILVTPSRAFVAVASSSTRTCTSCMRCCIHAMRSRMTSDVGGGAVGGAGAGPAAPGLSGGAPAMDPRLMPGRPGTVASPPPAPPAGGAGTLDTHA